MSTARALETLKKYFGFESFRPLQAEIIQSIFDQKDTLVVMPTGGGKSICFQLPAIVMDGSAVVVSPLISLMKDQVSHLTTNGIKAAYLNSSQNQTERRQIERSFYKNELDLIYVSPEKLNSESFLTIMKGTKINLFAIDEAHCISTWGHDFRLEYTQLNFLKQTFPEIPIAAFTATADKVTRTDIIDQLDLQHPNCFLASFDRPNLSIEVRPGQKRVEQIVTFIREKTDQSGIIYCHSRKETERLTNHLKKAGISAKFYHAGLSPKERMQIQEDFVKDEVPIIVATVAFGMGIDKSNVRWVIHYNMPKNIEGYYQEIGRAGRDNLPAETILFYSLADYNLLEDILQSNKSNNTEVQLSKLERMKQFSESLTCRRRLLLNYFGENQDKNCNNCDVCKNPPQYFDGTRIAQMALSAVFRLREREGITMVVDVLRGSQNQKLLQKDYQKIKTFGVGRNTSLLAWKYYILQLINLGLLELGPEKRRPLRLTGLSQKVLFENKKVHLVEYQEFKKQVQDNIKENQQTTEKNQLQRALFRELRKLRRRLALQEGIPPYIIFSDASLQKMAEKYPLKASDFLKIAGVSENKLEKYGETFLDTIHEFVQFYPAVFRGSSPWVTKRMYQKGFSIEEIAQKRKVQVGTIFGHMVRLYEKGEAINIEQFVNPEEIVSIEKALNQFKPPFKLKEIYECLNEQIDYHKIKFVIAQNQKNK